MARYARDRQTTRCGSRATEVSGERLTRVAIAGARTTPRRTRSGRRGGANGGRRLGAPSGCGTSGADELLLRIGSDDDGGGSGVDLVRRHADAVRVCANRLRAAGLVDADAAQRPVVLDDHVAADPADVGREVAFGDRLRARPDLFDLARRLPGVLAANDIGVHLDPLVGPSARRPVALEVLAPSQARLEHARVLIDIGATL